MTLLVAALRQACLAEGSHCVEWYVRTDVRAMRWLQISTLGRGFWERFDHGLRQIPTRGERSAEALERLIGQAAGGVYRLVPMTPAHCKGSVELTGTGLLTWLEQYRSGALAGIDIPVDFPH